jgi:glycosidase
MAHPRYPALFQVNTRVYLAEIAEIIGRPATLDDIPDGYLDAFARDGFDLVWLLGVWQTGEAARHVSASNPGWRDEYHRVLPDFRETDVCGSCFAVRDYHVHADFGGDAALGRLRERLRKRSLRLILDFVPNHVAPDHRWVSEHPEWFVGGTDDLLAAQPQNYCRVDTGDGNRILAYGRDPYFSGWPDTLQLNYGNPELQEALLQELLRIARQCDGVRCDMAMLVLPEVFERTWGIQAPPFWPGATTTVRREVSGFLFMAEVYWDLEWTLQQQGFDYTYDKRLYDRLEHRETRAAREHLRAGLDFQDRMVRFLENHDEPRTAATFPWEAHRAAAIVTFFTPGLRLFHQGQREGRMVRIPVHLGRGPKERPQDEVAAFYAAILTCLKDPAYRDGDWQHVTPWQAWDENWTWDSFVAFTWSGPADVRRLGVVNYSDHPSQCYLNLPWHDLQGKTWVLRDRLGTETYMRSGDELAEKGLYMDLPAWGYHLFDICAQPD